MAGSAREFFETLPGRLDPGATSGLTASYRFDVTGVGSWLVDVRDGAVTVEESDADADCAIELSEATFEKLRNGGSPTTAFLTGKIKVKGDMALATRVKDLLG